MLRRLIVYAGLLCLIPQPTLAQEAGCGLISSADLVAILKKPAEIRQTSQVPGRCHFEWPKPKSDQINHRNQDALRASMQRGGSPYQPLSTWASVDLEIYRQFNSVSEARKAFTELLGGVQNKSFGSPDPLSGQKFETLKQSAQPAAWSAQQQTLLFQSGKRLFMLKLDIEETPDKNRDLALQLIGRIQGQQR
jgi:hypothetical protein